MDLQKGTWCQLRYVADELLSKIRRNGDVPGWRDEAIFKESIKVNLLHLIPAPSRGSGVGGAGSLVGAVTRPEQICHLTLLLRKGVSFSHWKSAFDLGPFRDGDVPLGHSLLYSYTISSNPLNVPLGLLHVLKRPLPLQRWLGSGLCNIKLPHRSSLH